jgi:hypothetical protein
MRAGLLGREHAQHPGRTVEACNGDVVERFEVDLGFSRREGR